jgi:hypothetical protein
MIILVAISFVWLRWYGTCFLAGWALFVSWLALARSIYIRSDESINSSTEFGTFIWHALLPLPSLARSCYGIL